MQVKIGLEFINTDFNAGLHKILKQADNPRRMEREEQYILAMGQISTLCAYLHADYVLIKICSGLKR